MFSSSVLNKVVLKTTQFNTCKTYKEEVIHYRLNSTVVKP